MVLEGGVIEGRKVFTNIIKYIRMGASSNFGNMFSVLGASAFLPFIRTAPTRARGADSDKHDSSRPFSSRAT
jgi:magnesium-transporting ATPase (P-type)